MIFLTLLIIPVFIAVLFFLLGHGKVTWKEFLIHIGIQCFVCVLSMAIIYASNVWDNQVINGQVTDKKKEKVSCSHSYPCNCHEICSGSGNSRSCSTICSTCYMHSYDIDWSIYTNVDKKFEIERLDSQGLKEPPRWKQVRIGESVSFVVPYENYIKASPDSLFRNQGLVEKYKKFMTIYPIKVYDYWHIDRLVQIGTNIKDSAQLNIELQEINGRLGKKKEVNLVVVMVKDKPREFFYALQQHWFGGKKNDVIAVIGLDKEDNIFWVEVMSWSKDKLFDVTLRDDISVFKKFEWNKIKEVLEKDTDKLFIRTSMKEFSYLRSSITPTVGQWIFVMFFGLISSLGAGVYFFENEYKEVENESGDKDTFSGCRYFSNRIRKHSRSSNRS